MLGRRCTRRNVGEERGSGARDSVLHGLKVDGNNTPFAPYTETCRPVEEGSLSYTD